ncbi:riboflavin synthase [Xanthovirga aplysinae]|uniref:riboflavin synthase n=1 Tax=Xanthovirga aplysinae TaxID=2529853 RepID=UPI0012BC844A|nr:riboflavin synthase [Xanthovirga aplysinae]MTI32324.1 riboflavin synthase [Xanthovirga aplysinae]
MFTGIIETTGRVVGVVKEESNVHFEIESIIAPELKIDQSVAHNGVCLTVTAIHEQRYTVTAINETLLKTNLGELKKGDLINLERCVPMNGRFDGHVVQGHVDQIGKVVKVEEQHGSWLFTFEYDPSTGNVTVEKGSICINGTSLTCFNSKDNGFSVAIIPYTFEHTNFKQLKEGDTVNLEFDIIGKYVQRLLQRKD